MTAEISLPDIPQNAALLEHLRAASLPTKNVDYGGFELRTHPDLIERLSELVPTWPVIPAFGSAVVANSGIAAVAALGQSTLLFRLPSVPADLKLGPPFPPLTDLGWHSVDPWQIDLPTAEGIRKLSGMARGALEHVRSLRTPRAQPPV